MSGEGFYEGVGELLSHRLKKRQSSHMTQGKNILGKESKCIFRVAQTRLFINHVLVLSLGSFLATLSSSNCMLQPSVQYLF